MLDIKKWFWFGGVVFVVVFIVVVVLSISNNSICEDMLAKYEKAGNNSKSVARGLLIKECGQSILDGVDK
ncbi:hypothetical protein [uncultured Psychrosphaera sp.]|uniref:hypothetical protein n=1 Tax=uncultured Psychrosphaera sp. TaxID=1403522 RepID=UPI00261AD135|nr:hypothetical protein [uncultured Psychrosphaera sp.]